MNILDDLKKIKKLDSGQVLPSIELGRRQLISGWQGINQIKLANDFKAVDQIIVNGMGGSALASHIISTVFADQLKVPFTIINGYQIPASLNRRTLYLVCSYSGTTEEPLSTIALAKSRGAKIFAITSGGPLSRLVREKKVAGYVFNPEFNPSAQPRMGLGYALGIQLGLFKKIGLIKLSEAQINQAAELIGRLGTKFGVARESKNNLAKQLAQKMKGKMNIMVGSEFLAGNIHVFTNQINENAKALAAYFLLPELNHHLLEGLTFPKANRELLSFFFLTSPLYDKRDQARVKVTQKVLVKKKIDFAVYPVSSPDKLSAAVEVLVLGSYVSFYLAILYGVNPSLIPWVDYFKAELKKVS